MNSLGSTHVRPALVAGSFYPSSPSELAKMLAGFYHSAPKPSISGRPLAVISPHAGYIYSGQIAANGYKILEGESYRRVVVISPSHREAFSGVSAFGGRAYSTPFGEIPVDEGLTEAIASSSDIVNVSDKGHTGSAFGGEHAIEVQLPFLQMVLRDFKLVALVMGEQDYDTCKALGDAVGDALGDSKDALIVASSDLSHFYDSKTASVLDSIVIEHVRNFDYEGLARDLASNRCEACGGGPIIAAMIAARRMGADSVEITGYADSGDVSNDKSNVVGYLSAIVYGSEGRPPYEASSQAGAEMAGRTEAGRGEVRDGPVSSAEFGLSREDKVALLQIARQAIESHLKGERRRFDSEMSDALQKKLGVFVTLRRKGELRGCIGTFKPSQPLYMTVAEMACQAATGDFRFVPVTLGELAEIDIEISVLTPMKRVDDPKEVEVGRHGLYMRRGISAGVLLPQVPVEYGWDRQKFLEQTCLKAGLAPDDWKDKQTEIYVFEAEVFSEE